MIDCNDKLDALLVAQAKELFEMCDVDQIGKIYRKDFQRLSEIFNDSTELELYELYDSLDQKHKGFLTLDDMTQALKKSLENDTILLNDNFEVLSENSEIMSDETEDSAIENDDLKHLSVIYEENEETCFKESMSLLGISYNLIKE